VKLYQRCGRHLYCTEIDLMRSGAICGNPFENLRLLYIYGAVSRIQTPNGTRSRKAPDIAFMRIDGIKLINPPVINLL